MKKLFQLTAVAILMCIAVSCQSQKGMEELQGFNAAGMPVVDAPVTLNVMTSKAPAASDFKNMLVWQEMEKLTNVKVEWVEVPQQNAAEKRNISLASGDMPDVYFKMDFPPRDVEQYGMQGSFVKLNDYIDKYCPNVKAALVKYPEVEKGLKTVEGDIYSLPYIMDVLPPRITSKLFINTKWLDKIGMSMPTTTDEYYSILKAMKGKDFNGDGKTDEYPLTAGGIAAVMGSFKGAWGLGNRGNGAGNFDIDEKTGELRFWRISEAYKGMLEYLNRLYTEGLLDQEIFTATESDLTGKASQGRVGSFTAINNNFAGQKYQNEFKGLTEALTGPGGDKLWTAINSRLWGMGGFTMSATNKYPQVTMRWIDHLYSDEGAKLYFTGVEGVTSRLSADGSRYEYTEEITKNPDGLSYDQAMFKYLCWGGFANPSIALEKYFAGPAMQPISLEAANSVTPYLTDELWSRFAFTQNESDFLINTEKDINTYIDEMTANFIAGKASFAQWDEYVKTLRNMQLDKVIETYQKSYERGKN